jgi:putative membrane protein
MESIQLQQSNISDSYGLKPPLNRNDKKANVLIWIVSIVVFLTVAMLSKLKWSVDLGFNPHLFASANAVINSVVTILLLSALLAVNKNRYLLHKRLMITAIILSLLFLISYICHHLFAGETRYGDINHDNILSPDETAAAGSLRILYYFVLATHIPLAGIILPFILFTAYRALTGDYARHKKLARVTWPIWLYVAISGVVVYMMINPYY